MDINPSDLVIDTIYNGSTWFAKCTGIRITHKPSGFFGEAKDERSQHRNREVAYNILLEKLKDWDGMVATAYSENSVLKEEIAQLKSTIQYAAQMESIDKENLEKLQAVASTFNSRFSQDQETIAELKTQIVSQNKFRDLDSKQIAYLFEERQELLRRIDILAGADSGDTHWRL